MDRLNNPAARPIATSPRISTGVDGLDAILGGGLTPERLYLLEGTPGTGKTTFALKFLMAGVAEGCPGLYVTLSETASELRAVADSHGWSLDGIEVHELGIDLSLTADQEQSILHPSEIELGETIQEVIAQVERLNPARMVFDSLSELRLLAQEPLRYRRQILALKQFFSRRACTVLLLDDKTAEPGDLQLHSIAHGVISLEQAVQPFGPERRRVRVVKMRGTRVQSGLHDFVLDTGHVEVFPRLTASGSLPALDARPMTTGSPQLDSMLGGGLVPGSNTLLLGPAGVGKTTASVYCMVAALRRGERAAYFLFDEGVPSLLARSQALGVGLQSYVDDGRLVLNPVDPAELSPGEFASRVMQAVRRDGARFIAIDSLNAYMQAMPGQKYLLLHMHELLSRLGEYGVTTMLVVSQHGLIGEARSEVELSYLSDVIVLFRYFEAKGQIHTAITAVKSRVGENQRSIREFRLTAARGMEIGAELADFEGVLSGLPTYRGATPLLTALAHDDARD